MRELLIGDCRYSDLLKGLPGIGDESIVIESRGGAVKARPGSISDPDLTLTGFPELALGIMMGRVTKADALKRGLKIDGDTRLLDRLRRPH